MDGLWNDVTGIGDSGLLEVERLKWWPSPRLEELCPGENLDLLAGVFRQGACNG